VILQCVLQCDLQCDLQCVLQYVLQCDLQCILQCVWQCVWQCVVQDVVQYVFVVICRLESKCQVYKFCEQVPRLHVSANMSMVAGYVCKEADHRVETHEQMPKLHVESDMSQKTGYISKKTACGCTLAHFPAEILQNQLVPTGICHQISIARYAVLATCRPWP